MSLHDDPVYALLALDVSAKLDGTSAKLGSRFHATHQVPIALPDRLKDAIGTTEFKRLSGCRLFLLVSGPDASGSAGSERVWLEDRLDLFLRSLTLTSVGFRMSYGILMSGMVREGDNRAVQVRRFDAITASPGMPLHFVVQRAQLEHAERVSQKLRELRSTRGFERLWRALRAFDLALTTQDLALRLHQLVRAIEGVVVIPADKEKRLRLNQREWYASRVALMCSGLPTASDLLDLYDSRGATEHLALPVRDIQRNNPGMSAGDAEVPLARLVFLAEGIARHALVRVIEKPELHEHFVAEDSAIAFWNQDAEKVRSQWGDPFPVDQYLTHFDGSRAQQQLEQSRQRGIQYREIVEAAPPSFWE